MRRSPRVLIRSQCRAVDGDARTTPENWPWTVDLTLPVLPSDETVAATSPLGTLSWRNPTDVDYAHVSIWRNSVSDEVNASDAVLTASDGAPRVPG